MALNLDKIFYLNRASLYTNPANTNDRLPIVYGDLTDGSRGNWTTPCIDTVNDVYCFANHPVLSVANGNSITVYENDVTVNPTNYTFSDSNNYESQGNIATITFTTPPTENAIISVRGKGKYTPGDATILMTNIIDIIDDLLVTEGAVMVSGDFDTSLKTIAYNNFVSQAYIAAGVINEDESYWSLIYKMISSFKGEAFINANGKMALTVDNGLLPQRPANILSGGDTKFIGATLKRENIINRLPSNYRYNYVLQQFISHTNDSAQSDVSSIGIYGESTPNTPYQFYFCRDLTSINKVQTLIVASQKSQDKLWEVEFQDNTLKHIDVDIGDYIIASFDLLYNKNAEPLKNEFFKVLETQTDFNSGAVLFRCLDTGTPLSLTWKHDGTIKHDGVHQHGGEIDLTDY